MATTACLSYAGYRFPAEIISHAVWLYFRFPLRLRMVDELLAARGHRRQPRDRGGAVTALALHNAASIKFAPHGVMLPWPVLCKAVNAALNSHFLEVVPGGPVPWPCEAQGAAAVSFRLPVQASAGTNGANADPGKPPFSGFGMPPNPGVEPSLAEARLDTAGLTNLADALGDMQQAVAAYGIPLVFRVSVEAHGLPADAREIVRKRPGEGCARVRWVGLRWRGGGHATENSRDVLLGLIDS